jgi:hypothetical protein
MKVMKQYTTPEQTAKLIELGFEKPKSIEVYRDGHCVPFVEQRWDYSIGELIEMLPEKVTDKHEHDAILQMTCFNGEWRVKYAGAYDVGLMIAHELIDALYYMLIDLLENDLIHLKSNGNTKDK